ncbi:hypothetical protein FRC02_007036 [Tulasnella sp. 418]|nr:hypothetical protein FRC02_007036 [Tulasnella sp. 418]
MNYSIQMCPARTISVLTVLLFSYGIIFLTDLWFSTSNQFFDRPLVLDQYDTAGLDGRAKWLDCMSKAMANL